MGADASICETIHEGLICYHEAKAPLWSSRMFCYRLKPAGGRCTVVTRTRDRTPRLEEHTMKLTPKEADRIINDGIPVTLYNSTYRDVFTATLTAQDQDYV